MKKIGVMTVHGMGKYEKNYYRQLEHRLKTNLGKDWDSVSFVPCQYAPVFQDNQNAYWNDVRRSKETTLRWRGLREFALFGFSDASSLEHSANRDWLQYIDVQNAIQTTLTRIYSEIGTDPEKKVVIIANSLGGQVVSNYLWDAAENLGIFRQAPVRTDCPDDFLRLKTLTHFITTGCNIPLFTAGLSERVCFKLPNDGFQWDNFYDPDDVLGWPLKQLGTGYRFVRDHIVRSGNIVQFWNPLSHKGYWNNRTITKEISDIIRSTL